MYGTFHQQVEASLPGRATGGALRPPRGAPCQCAHAEDGGSHSRVDAEGADRRIDSLEHAPAAKKLGIHHMMVARTWKKYGLEPHRPERYKSSNDPDFERKAAAIIGLHLNPPQHAAFDTKTGGVLGKTVRRYTSHEFVAFLEQVVASNTSKREIHVILNSYSAHRTARITHFLEANPRVTLHFTPTYSSWLNQVEIWFSKIERQLIRRGVFMSTTDLKHEIMRYIRRYNEGP